jgi:hypothetical protein
LIALVGDAAEGSAVLRKLRPNTRRGLILNTFGLPTFFLLDVLALMRRDLATELLVSLSGVVSGAAVAYASTRPFRRLVGTGIWQILRVFFGLAMPLVFAGSALASIPAFSPARSGKVGVMIYDVALGFGIPVPRGLGFSTASEASGREAHGSDLRTVVLVLGVVAGLFALLFVLFVLAEYLAAPLILRYFVG